MDTAAGIDGSVLTFSSACEMVIVVVCDEPTSITDAYALIKVLNRECGVKQFQVLANMVEHESQVGRSTPSWIAWLIAFSMCTWAIWVRFRGTAICAGRLQQQSAVVERYPHSDASRALEHVASRIGVDVFATQGGGGLGFLLNDWRIRVPGWPRPERYGSHCLRTEYGK